MLLPEKRVGFLRTPLGSIGHARVEILGLGWIHHFVPCRSILGVGRRRKEDASRIHAGLHGLVDMGVLTTHAIRVGKRHLILQASGMDRRARTAAVATDYDRQPSRVGAHVDNCRACG